MVNSVLSALPTYTMGVLSLPEGTKAAIEKRLKICLRQKSEFTGRCKALGRWDLVCLPKFKGGLGIMNLTAFNDALLLKHLYKFFNRQNLPWVQLIWHSYYAGLVPHALGTRGSFWWRDIMKLEGKFRDFAKVILGDGGSVRFWEDDWGHGVLASRFSRCYSFFKDRNLAVKNVVDSDNLLSLLHLPVSVQAFNELREVQGIIYATNLDASIPDAWRCAGGSSSFSSRNIMLPVLMVFNLIWSWVGFGRASVF